ncbi:unnamed protein product, partial [Bodo saltans]
MLRRCMLRYVTTPVNKNAGKTTELVKPLRTIFQSWPDVWTADQWNEAKVATESAAYPQFQSILLCAYKAQDVRAFKDACKVAFPPPAQGPLSLEKYFEHRIKFLQRKCISLSEGSLFVCSAETLSSFNNRKVLPDGWALTPIEPIKISGADPFSPKKVTILSGESGSGKTTKALMSSSYGVYITTDDIRADLAQIETLKEDHQKDERNAAVVRAVTAAVAKSVAGIFDEAALLTNDSAGFSIVLDEFGNYPHFIHSLCAAQDEIRSALMESLFPLHEVELRLIVVGTGTDVKKTKRGSYPPSCVALTMPDDAPMLKMVKTSIQKKSDSSFASLLLEALHQHTQATHLICNPRFAALLFKRIVEFHAVEANRRWLFITVEQMLTCLDAYLVQAATDFRRLNAMSSKNQDGVEECYAIALEMLFRPATDGIALSHDQHALFSDAGVMTDRAYWHPDDLPLPRGYVRLEGSVYDCGQQMMVLIAPTEGRFRMSMAQQLLFRMAYGFGSLEPAISWQRYRVVVAEYAGIVLAGHKGRKLRDIMARFGCKSNDATEEPAAFSKPVDYDGVVLVHSSRRIKPKMGTSKATTLKELHTKYTNLGKAVVIVNGAGALYADVIVLIPNVAVILIRGEYWDDGTGLAISDVVDNMKSEVAALSTIR